uniref:Putative secreted protein n=1 Tax=Rhipicephalus microplus TaxID=6941 RepID=A0A6G5A164_RHIMP
MTIMIHMMLQSPKLWAYLICEYPMPTTGFLSWWHLQLIQSICMCFEKDTPESDCFDQRLNSFNFTSMHSSGQLTQLSNSIISTTTIEVDVSITIDTIYYNTSRIKRHTISQ